jgi:membrane protein implicated in regulation of membrane protease activity
VLLAVLYPGLGHVYLREWGRALLWFVLVIVSSTFLIPDGAVPATLSVDALVGAAGAIPTEVSLLILTLSFVSVLDAYWLARRINERARPTVDEQGNLEAEDCPNCGKELDTDIEFCPWCSERLVATDDADEEEPTAG